MQYASTPKNSICMRLNITHKTESNMLKATPKIDHHIQ